MLRSPHPLCSAVLRFLFPLLLFLLLPLTGQAAGFSLAESLNADTMLLTGIFFGILGASFIYVLSTFVAIHDRSQIFLMLMLLCLVVHVLAGGGYLGGEATHPLVALYLKDGALLLFYLFSCAFTLIFLEVSEREAAIRFALYAAMACLVLALILAALETGFVLPYLPALGLGVLALLLVTALLAWRARVGGALPHFAAFGVVFVGTLSTLPPDIANPAASPFFSRDITMLAYALCAMLFAVVIASQFARRQEIKERELATSNERFQLAAQGSNEGLYDWDVLKKDGYFSGRLRRLFGSGFVPGPQAVKAWMRLIHADDRTAVRQMLFAFLRDPQQSTVTLEYRIVRSDKRQLWVTTTGVAVRDKKTGRLRRLIGSVGDITEKKRGEARLRASEARFRSIAEAHPVPVLIATLKEGEIVYASSGAADLFRVAGGDMLGLGLDSFFTDATSRRDIMADVEKKGGVTLREVTLQRADHATLHAALSARRIDYERRPCAVVGVYDMTERKASEAKIKDQEAALQQSEKLAALGGLLAGVAHELNNPLSVVVGQATLLGETAKDEKTSARADKIRKAGERCSRIVRSFLALARRKPAERKPMAINEVIEGSLELTAFQLRTDNVELQKNLDPHLPDALADSDQMTQVITNLVINAKQALQEKEGARRVVVESRYRAADNMIVVSVTDNGPGVPPDIIHRIFEPFFTTKPAGSGTGVGLSLCHNIIESHGGRIWVEDAEGGGARFIFTLPAQTTKEAAGDNLKAMLQPAPEKVLPQNILIVDDEVELAQTLADILGPDGHTTTLAEHGARALALLREQPFDIIISDLRMPVMDGPTLYRELEQTMPDYLPRIIFVTGDTLSTHVSAFLSRYQLDVIEKPYTPEDVRAKIRQLLGKEGMRKKE